eukprot:m.115464 g.115464  ORF g.115464 m.115464 type:complete len:225 (-) comp9291_c2_seq2:2228-2902(-)
MPLCTHFLVSQPHHQLLLLMDLESASEDRKISSKRGTIGGFHKAEFPFQEGEDDKIKSLGTGQYAVIMIDSEKERVVVESTGTCAPKASEIRLLLNDNEPRFYIFNFRKPLFIHVIPDSSRARSRMLYSTTKAGVVANIKKLGISTAISLEISDGHDIDDSNILGKVTKWTGSDGQEKKSNAVKTVVPSQVNGSLSSFMAQSLGKSAMSKGKKRVVLPPKHAYG